MTGLPFSNRKSVIAVIHCESTDQTLRNTEIAATGGCDGVFLINHTISVETLLKIHQSVRTQFPNYWLGVNFLGVAVVDVFRDFPINEIDGIWTDNAGVDELSFEQCEARAIKAAIRRNGWSGTYFGGVAFKYQRPVNDVALAAHIASQYMDIVCTSGPGTGKLAATTKLASMHHAIAGRVPLAVASGITPENVLEVIEYVDVFLVATGISRSFTELDPQLVRSLTAKVATHSQTTDCV